METMETVEYAPGRLADVHGDPDRRTVLMWHGAQVDARASMGPLAERVARQGAGVVVADWNSRADDRGRADLLASLRYARDVSATPESIVLVGWSLGGVAAAGATIHAANLDLEIGHTVCLAGAFMVADPISGQSPTITEFGRGAPFTLLHGVRDDVIAIEVSRDFAATLRRNGWPVEFTELPTDHAAIAGAAYDSTADRYAPARDPDALLIADNVAERIADIVRAVNL